MLFWEDFRPGDAADIGEHTFTEDEIVAFARQFDPQPFHLDAEAARNSIYRGLIASGWHTCAVAMRLMVEAYIGRAASAGSPGVENIRWTGPVRPGDTIRYRRVIVEARPSESRPGIGLVRSRTEAANQRGEIVMTMEGWGLFRRRPAA